MRTPVIMPTTSVGSFLKWAGGKSRLLPQFQRFLPETLEGRGYVEPFMGSAAVFFHVVQTRNPARCTLLDCNADLVNLFVQIRDNLDSLLPLLQEHRKLHNAPEKNDEQREEYYYAIRAQTPLPGSLEAAARFLYLNKTCFNGLHRVNSKGKFNVPMGRYVNPSIFDEDQMRAASALLQEVKIEVADFRNMGDFIEDNDFVYLDPPYEPLSRTSSFNAYAADGFSQADQLALRDKLVELSPRCKWMLSNSSAPFIEEAYSVEGVYVNRVSASRMINSSAAGRGKVDELLVTNYYQGTDVEGQPHGK